MCKNTLVLLLVVLSACGSKKQDDKIYASLEESLIASNRVIRNSTIITYMAMEEKMLDHRTRAKAEWWQPKMKQLSKLSNESYEYIENLKKEFSNTDAVDDLFPLDKRGAELYDKMKQYYQTVLSIEPLISESFKTKPVIFSASFDSSKHNADLFAKIYFSDVSREAALTNLTKFQNNVCIIENRMASLFLEQVGTIGGWFTRFSAIVGQSSTIVKPKEEIEITAGVGGFSSSAKPEIIVGKKIIAINEEGTANYKFKAPAKPGKYSTKVTIHYTDQDGQRQTTTKDVQYTVAEEQ